MSGTHDGERAATNVEWELADFVDAIAAEFDRAEDTLALKSYGRGALLSVRGIALDLGVGVRRAADGRVFFHATEPGAAGAATLRLDFGPLLQSQVEGARRPLDEVAVPRSLDALPGITPRDTAALRALGVFTADGLERCTPTPAALAAVARKTEIPEPRLQRWLGLSVPGAGRLALHGIGFARQPVVDEAVRLRQAVLAEAAVANEGDGALEPFLLAWVVDGVPLPSRRHGPLPAGARSTDPATRCELRLGAGRHTVWAIAGPELSSSALAAGELTL
jgi:hypothetical protein